MIGSTNELLTVLERSRVLEESQFALLARKLAGRTLGPLDVARLLLRQRWLTAFQINELFRGRGAGLVLGPYVFEKILGKGGMGAVYKVRHRMRREHYALKLLRPEHVDCPEITGRLRRELQAASQLDHPNIVRAVVAGRHQQRPYLVMEYLPGVDLDRLVKQCGPLPVDLACEYIRQAALGLDHAHARGLIHRDVKPANLLVSPSPTSGRGGRSSFQKCCALSHSHVLLGVAPKVKLLDLGLARLDLPEDPEMRTPVEVIVGTPDYLAPEQASNPKRADGRADLYSLGCTFYYLLHGQAPYPGGTAMEKVVRHWSSAPPPIEQLRPAVPPAVGQLVRRLMARNPDARPASGAAVAGALQELLAGASAPLAQPVTKRSTVAPVLGRFVRAITRAVATCTRAQETPQSCNTVA